MPRPRSAAEDGEESNDALLQEEYERLQNQYRILENDRRKYIVESQDTLRRQQEEIDHLEQDNKEIRTNLNQAQSQQNQKADKQTLNRLSELTKEKDDLDEQIELERSNIAGLDADIRKAERDNKTMKKKSGGNAEKTSQERSKTLHKRRQTLENRLEKDNKRYNDTLTENSRLRDEIEKMRTEKSLYDDLYRKLSEELEEVRQRRSYLTESATKAYEQRDDCNNKIVALREKNEKDEVQYKNEKRDLERFIDHDNKLREFMTRKANTREEWKKEAEERRLKHGSHGEKAKEAQRRIYEKHDEAMQRIKEITEEDDLDIIVKEFIQKEDENFALFQYVSEQNNIIEMLIEEIEKLKKDMEQFIEEDSELEKEREKILAELERKIAAVKEARVDSAGKQEAVKKTLEELQKAIKSIFDKCGCSDGHIREMLGADDDISSRNCMLYLGEVEQKTNELLAVQYYLQTKKYEKEDNAPPPQHGLTLGMVSHTREQTDVQVLPPAIGDDFEDDDDPTAEVRPMSQGELKQKVERHITRKDLGKPKREKTVGRNPSNVKKAA
ncbi:hypothetical protein BOX15_Mlig017320g1 [Macrostomum lignano]|uniref:ODAD1 central coiled coil region domain-containing protein n=1 Tax=Macrostomum lignano TaxID=282301 RepID=A0A267F3A3_9PLAT|nr:hypothetical protein BOX15_Mlig017320g1 [Macrostomum lignano]